MIYINNLNLHISGKENPVQTKGTYAPFTKSNLPDGVYIRTESGKFWLPQFWGLASESPNAVAVVKDGKRLLIALKGSDEGIELLPSGTKVDLTEYSSVEEALKDNSGRENTDILLKAGSKAAKFCREFGGEWYLPTLSEMQSMYEFKKDIDAALAIAGGDPLDWRYHWTSTRYSKNCSWIFHWYLGYRDYFDQGNYYRVRPVSAF